MKRNVVMILSLLACGQSFSHPVTIEPVCEHYYASSKVAAKEGKAAQAVYWFFEFRDNCCIYKETSAALETNRSFCR